MRKMLIMCGAPGSGKSTLAHTLEQLLQNELSSPDDEGIITLSLDTFRHLMCPVQRTEDESTALAANAFRKQYMDAYDIAVKSHVQAGTTIIIDNTNTRQRDFRKTADFAKRYGYDVAFARFIADTNTLHAQNAQRRGSKIVSDTVIDDMQQRLENLDLSKFKVFDIHVSTNHHDDIHAVAEKLCYEFFDTNISLYPTHKNVMVLGDVHGEAERLRQALQDARQLDAQLVFSGDILDRGTDSVEVVRILDEIMNTMPDTVFVEGNHDSNIRRITQDADNVSEKMFTQTKRTLQQINSAPDHRHLKQVLHEYVKRLVPGVAFDADNTTYIVTHGGLNQYDTERIAKTHAIPAYLSQYDCILGCCVRDNIYNAGRPADYSRHAIDGVKGSINGNHRIVQIHGHRNAENDARIDRDPVTNQVTRYNLESKVETDNGCLSAVVIDTQTAHETLKTYHDRTPAQPTDTFSELIPDTKQRASTEHVPNICT